MVSGMLPEVSFGMGMVAVHETNNRLDTNNKDNTFFITKLLKINMYTALFYP